MKKASYLLPVAASLFLVAAVPATNFAQTTSGSNVPASRIGNSFTDFLQNVDSQQVVNDLRNGQWTTTTTDPTSNVTTTTTQALPTGKMGWGNVDHSLLLAQHSLSQQGITQPTSEQLYTALAGGEMVAGDPTTATKGVLQMRAEGMGWGEIAQQYGTKLGHLKSGKLPASATTTGTTTTSASSTSKGIVTGSGKSSSGSNLTVGKGNSKAFAGSKSQGNGIVSASGQSGGNSSSSMGGGSRGIVSGSGRAVGHTSGIVTGAGGNGNQYGVSGGGHGNGNGGGMAKGHNR